MRLPPELENQVANRLIREGLPVKRVEITGDMDYVVLVQVELLSMQGRKRRIEQQWQPHWFKSLRQAGDSLALDLKRHYLNSLCY